MKRLRLRRRFALGLTCGLIGATVALAPSASASPSGSETIVLRETSADRSIDWTASGVFADSGTWRGFCFAGGGGASFGGQCFTREFGANGSFRVDLQIHRNDVTGTGVYGTWVVDIGSGADVPSGAYVGLRGQGTFTLEVDPATGVRTYTLVGDVHFE